MDYLKQSDSINKIFEQCFNNSYKSINLRGKSKLLKFTLSFYRRWFYSALVDDTFLSPANLFAVLNEQSGKSTSDFPLPKVSGFNRQSPLNFFTQQYSLDSHPIVADLKKFLESCSPDFELTQEDSLSDAHQDMLMKTLSIADPFYIDYLTVISINLSLIKKIPSIYSNRAQLTPESKKFLELPERKILDEVFNAAVELTVFSLGRMLPIAGIITPTYIKSILQKPVTTDEVFDYIYDKLGLDIGDIFEAHEGYYADGMYEAILSSTFFFGIVMDKYFYTPFGFYFRFINPSYLLTYDMKKDMLYALETSGKREDISVAIFSPCSHYRITDLGKEYLEVDTSAEPPVLPELPFEILADIVFNSENVMCSYDAEIKEMLTNSMNSPPLKVYDLKIRLMNNKPFWKNMDVLDNISLHDLYMEICCEFNFDTNMDYSFYSSLEQSPFSEYTSPIKNRRSKKAEKTSLHDLNLAEKNHFMLVLRDTASPYEEKYPTIPLKAVKIELEVRKIKARSYNKYYPMVTRESQSFADLGYEWLY